MARTEEDILNSLIQKKNLDTNLANLVSKKAASYWYGLFKIIASGLATFEANYDAWKAQLIIDKAAVDVGGLGWYVERSLKWQQGEVPDRDSIDKPYQYSLIDESKQVVKFTSAANGSPTGEVDVKVAKLTAGLLVALITAERDELQTYLDTYVKPGGIIVNLTTAESDKVEVTAELFVESGYKDSDVKAAVQVAIDNYLKSEIYGGIIRASKIIDAALAVEGVQDFQPSQYRGRTDAGGYSVFTFEYTAVAGHAILENYDSTVTIP